MKSTIQSSILALSFLTSAAAYATGTMGSGGGKSVVCRDANKAIVSASLLDLYEGQTVFDDLPAADTTRPSEEYLTLAKSRLAKTGYSLLKPGIKSVDETVAYVQAHLKILPKGVEPTPTDDSNEFISVPAGCAIEQAAYFAESGLIVVSQNIWNAFSNLDKAALVLHESVYWLDRQTTLRQDARRARRVVSLSLSQKWSFAEIGQGLPDHYTLCQNLEAPLTTFAVYSPAQNYQTVQFFALNGDPLLSKTETTIPSFPFLDNEGDVNTSYSTQNSLSSSFEGNTGLFLARNPILDTTGKPVGSAIQLSAKKEAYPQWETSQVNVVCIPL